MDEIVECEKETEGTDASPTRADILDNGFDDLDDTVPQTETSRGSRSASVEDDLTVHDTAAENSHEAAGASPSASEREEANDDVWTSRATSDAYQPPPDCTAEANEELEEPDAEGESQEQGSSCSSLTSALEETSMCPLT